MTGPVVPYESVEHLHDDIEAAKHAAVAILNTACTHTPEADAKWYGKHAWYAALDALGAVWEWLDTVEASAAAVIDQAPNRDVTEPEAA